MYMYVAYILLKSSRFCLLPVFFPALPRSDRTMGSSSGDDDADKSADLKRRRTPSTTKTPSSKLAVTVMAHHALSWQDKVNIALLVVLYLLQGIPVGLAFGSVPFLLKQKVSFSDIGIFSFAQYPYRYGTNGKIYNPRVLKRPLAHFTLFYFSYIFLYVHTYSLKLLWSPIVDSVYWKRIGRRKSWIIPMQTIIALFFFGIGSTVDDVLEDDNLDVYHVTFWFVALILCAATQDIAVDGWALELLPKEHLEYASTCQTVGLNTGFFLSFTCFLALNSAEFCNSFLRSEPLSYGVLQLGTYIQFWGLVALVTTLWLALFKDEPHQGNGDMTVKGAYHTMWQVATLPSVRGLLVILMVHKIGFMANDAVTALLLIDKGFKREDLALTGMKL